MKSLGYTSLYSEQLKEATIIESLVFLDSSSDAVHSSCYKDENDMDAERIILATEGYIVCSNNIRRLKKKLYKSLCANDYKKYFKTIKKIAKMALKEIK